MRLLGIVAVVLTIAAAFPWLSLVFGESGAGNSLGRAIGLSVWATLAWVIYGVAALVRAWRRRRRGPTEGPAPAWVASAATAARAACIWDSLRGARASRSASGL